MSDDVGCHCMTAIVVGRRRGAIRHAAAAAAVVVAAVVVAAVVAAAAAAAVVVVVVAACICRCSVPLFSEWEGPIRLRTLSVDVDVKQTVPVEYSVAMILLTVCVY